jgi:hypothetical protein
VDAGPPCTATVASGAVPLTDNYIAGSVIGDGGYAFSYADGITPGGSTACVNSTALCATGQTGVSSMTVYGAGIGFNLNQMMATSSASPPINTYSVMGVGISYSLSNMPTQGARIAIGDSDGTTGTDYCATLPGKSGTVLWSSFNTKCWDNSGTSLSGPPSNPVHVEFQVPAGATAAPFDFCVTSVSFASSAPDAGVSMSCGSSCCEPSSGPAASGNGEITCYTFKQGTAGNKTFCGYNGSEAAGPGGNGPCQQGQLNYSDSVPNVGTNPKYFAAYPIGAFGQGTYCGMCVNVTYNGKTLMGTIVDECATCPNNQHIDLSADLARDIGLGVNGGMGDVTGVTWKAVACPISSNNGHIVAVFNSNNPASGQVYFQNVVFPVKTVSGATQTNGYWSPVTNGQQATLTDIYGHSVTATIVSGDIGVQFPATCP